MQIRWANIVAFGLALFTLVTLIRYRYPISDFLGMMGEIGPGHDPHSQTLGLVAFGLVLVGIVALTKILTHNRRP